MSVTGKPEGLVSQVMSKLVNISTRVGKDVYVSSGKRDGDINDSAHNSGIAADIKIDGKNTADIARELVTEGFTGVGEYYNTSHEPFNFAHGDIRGLPGSEKSGAYAKGERKGAPLCWWREGTETDGVHHFGECKSGLSCSSSVRENIEPKNEI